jgi:hypothetical protein
MTPFNYIYLNKQEIKPISRLLRVATNVVTALYYSNMNKCLKPSFSIYLASKVNIYCNKKQKRQNPPLKHFGGLCPDT